MQIAIVPIEHMKNTCKPGMGDGTTCRYLGFGPGGFQCLKHTEFKSLLDDRVAKNTINAQGDNCEGIEATT